MRVVSLIPALAVLFFSASAWGAANGFSPRFCTPNPSVGWVSAGVRLLPPPSGPGPVVADPGRRTTSNNDVRASGAQALFAMGDLSAPILQPWRASRCASAMSGFWLENLPSAAQASCWPVGTPGFLLYAVQPVYFVQSPKVVVMIWQADHQVRHVYYERAPSPNPKPSWFGESVGHYEGDMLVVDTIASDTRTFIDQFETPHTEKLHTIERFT